MTNIFDRSPVSNGVTTEEARRGTSSPMSVQFAAFSIDNNGLQRDKDRKNTNNHKVTSSSHRIARVSPDSQTEGLPPPITEKSPVRANLMDEEEFPDYKK